MASESLEELGAAFEQWRSEKRHAREATPERLLDRARRAVATHGLGRVARITRVDRDRLKRSGRRVRSQETGVGVVMPTFSRVEVPAPLGRAPIAEVEIPGGVKVRVFAETDAMLGLLRAVCGTGGVE